MSVGNLEDLGLGDLQQLYETDNYHWLLTNLKLLRNKQFDQLDLENLIEELTDLGTEKKNAVESLLQQVIRHLLLYQYWNLEIERNSGHWQAEIYNFRDQLNSKLTSNLRSHIDYPLIVPVDKNKKL